MRSSAASNMGFSPTGLSGGASGSMANRSKQCKQRRPEALGLRGAPHVGHVGVASIKAKSKSAQVLPKQGSPQVTEFFAVRHAHFQINPRWQTKDTELLHPC